MKLFRKTDIVKAIKATVLTLGALLTLSSCDAFNEKLDPCPQGLKIRFIYDYTLEGGNAFPAQVDCLTLHVYDAAGNYVCTATETSEALKDENYRMVLDLPEGSYSLVAYGGVACENASFSHTALPDKGSRLEDVGMQINDECLEPGNPKGHLHDLFYGAINVSVNNPITYTEATVPMMKDTNHFRILLQHLNYEPLHGKDYEFEITDDNTLFDHTNMLVDNGKITYTPWAKGQVSTGVTDGSRVITEVNLAYAELSTSRLMTMRHPRLVVRHIPSGKTCIDIPLINYLLALRSDRYMQYKDQEFLDRQSNWDMLFFMSDAQTWYKAYIKVNNWDVRINDIEN